MSVEDLDELLAHILCSPHAACWVITGGGEDLLSGQPSASYDVKPIAQEVDRTTISSRCGVSPRVKPHTC